MTEKNILRKYQDRFYNKQVLNYRITGKQDVRRMSSTSPEGSRNFPMGLKSLVKA